MKYASIIRRAAATPWAIMPSKLEEIADLLRLKAEGVDIEFEAAGSKQTQQAGSVAILPVFGTITPRANMLTEFSGGTSAEQFTKSFRAALNDSRVSAILLDVDSPGGSVQGIPELASEIRAARGQKPIAAVSNHLMASAAYWIGAAAGELAISPSGEVGSVGVFAMHTDESAALEAEGVRHTIISAGKYKTELASVAPLSADAKAEVQRQVDYYYGLFVDSLAASRGTDSKRVREAFGEGRLVNAKDSLAAGMVDRIATLDEMISRLSSPQGRAAVQKRQPGASALLARRKLTLLTT